MRGGGPRRLSGGRAPAAQAAHGQADGKAEGGGADPAEPLGEEGQPGFGQGDGRVQVQQRRAPSGSARRKSKAAAAAVRRDENVEKLSQNENREKITDILQSHDRDLYIALLQ